MDLKFLFWKFGNFYKNFFAMSLKYINFLLVVFEDFYIIHILKSFLNRLTPKVL